MKNYQIVKWIFLGLAMVGFLVLFASTSRAVGHLAVANDTLGAFPGEDLSATDVTNIAWGLACWATRAAFGVAVIFLVLAGLRFTVAQGNPQAFTKAKDNLVKVVWGTLVILGFATIIATVANAVGITDFSFIPLVC